MLLVLGLFIGSLVFTTDALMLRQHIVAGISVIVWTVNAHEVAGVENEFWLYTWVQYNTLLL